ncbi:uncharacterized protein FIBRA_05295 [Fibroporia radiculosa]|uniref:BTB domain-containing protein n=1 Tax=Fibroporia radiculosa TaxID=599839 RepID=J4G909_9APHY|nr:uncharacterized protein FIBRA_05295 [Fibroporia radiculosa]CCM03173.1 predicted protein [Fibroporia radiculosa]
MSTNAGFGSYDPSQVPPNSDPLHSIFGSPSSGTNPETDVPKRHREYYFGDGNVILLVENTLYKLHRSILERHSTVFREMWCVPPPENSTEGKVDENPIVLAGVNGGDFIRLLWILYPSVLGSWRATTADEWSSILDQADRWQIDSLRFHAVSQLKMLIMDPMLKISIWMRYNLDPNDLVFAYATLITRGQSLSLAEANSLGMELFVKVAAAREKIHKEGLNNIRGGHIWAGVNPASIRPNKESEVLVVVKEYFGVPCFTLPTTF